MVRQAVRAALFILMTLAAALSPTASAQAPGAKHIRLNLVAESERPRLWFSMTVEIDGQARARKRRWLDFQSRVSGSSHDSGLVSRKCVI